MSLGSNETIVTGGKEEWKIKLQSQEQDCQVLQVLVKFGFYSGCEKSLITEF